METARLVLIFVVLAGELFPVCGSADPTSEPIRDLFSLSSVDNILEEEHFGIANGRITSGIPYKGIAGIQGLWAPPLVSRILFSISSWATNRWLHASTLGIPSRWNGMAVSRGSPS